MAHGSLLVVDDVASMLDHRPIGSVSMGAQAKTTSDDRLITTPTVQELRLAEFLDYLRARSSTKTAGYVSCRGSRAAGTCDRGSPRGRIDRRLDRLTAAGS